MSFYRIYRPQTIEELDTKAVRDYVLSLLKKDKSTLPHAFLLTGPKGTGKTTTARLIAKIFNCEKPTASGEPCGSCDQCSAIAKGQHMDVREIDAASNTGVDNIRELRDSIALTPSIGSFAVYVIDEVHMLSTGAFNALLKTLEEPPPHALFILATTNPEKIPDTIVSRCVRLTFQKALPVDIKRSLERIIKKEKLNIDPDALSLIAENSDGSFRDAVKNLEQLSLSTETITRDLVQSQLLLSKDSEIQSFISALKKKDLKKALNSLHALRKSGGDTKVFITSCLLFLETELVALALDDKDKEVTVKLINTLTDAYTSLRISPIPLLPLEIAVIDLCATEEKHVEIDIEPDNNKPATEPQIISTTKEEESVSEFLSVEKLSECWKDFIEAMKEYNHSISGVLRSTRPKSVTKEKVTIEAFYSFHKEKLSEPKVRDALALTIKKLFGARINVEIVLGKK